MRIKSLALVAIIAAAGSSASGQVLWDNMTGAVADGGNWASQQFEAANTAFNVVAIDNFTLASNSTITSVDFCNSYFNGTGPTTNYRVEIYSSPAAALAAGTGMIGDVASSGLLAGGGSGVFPLFNTRAVNMSLNAGTYWVGIIAVQPFTPAGQSGTMRRTNINGPGEGWLVNAGGGFALPGNAAPFSVVQPSTPFDLIFRLNGTVPAPSSLALLGLGGVIAGRRRRSI